MARSYGVGVSADGQRAVFAIFGGAAMGPAWCESHSTQAGHQEPSTGACAATQSSGPA